MRAKIKRNSRNTTSNQPRACILLNVVSITIFKFLFLLITRRGRKARKMRRVFKKPGPSGVMKCITETATTIASSQFQPHPADHKYAFLPQTSGYASNFTNISKMNIIAKTLSASRTKATTEPLVASCKGPSIIIETVFNKMHTRMKLSKISGASGAKCAGGTWWGVPEVEKREEAISDSASWRLSFAFFCSRAAASSPCRSTVRIQ
mmetsp:Transcript_11048/g.31476  ORF Transcript_11048/g.31476 Transcript_11048/m.31476 type:complete len:207 (+) Transcript_11048:2809-3429(+)